MMARAFEMPDALKPVLRRALVLEWISTAYLSTVLVLMALVMGSSQAMKTAWVEDTLLPWMRDVAVRLRESGHVFYGDIDIVPRDQADALARCQEAQRVATGVDWRVYEVTVQLVPSLEQNGAS